MMLDVRLSSRIKRAARLAGSLAAKPVLLIFLSAVFLAAQPGQAQEPLNLFKNYFITGDYVVRGTSLWRRGVNGKAVVDIPAIGIPPTGGDGVTASADILAAFLYIQTAEKIRGSLDVGAGIDLAMEVR